MLSEVQLERLHVRAINAHIDVTCIVGCYRGLQKAMKGSATAAVVIFRVICATDDQKLFILDKDVCDLIPARMIIKYILDDSLCER
jgi:hypothetical protein